MPDTPATGGTLFTPTERTALQRLAATTTRRGLRCRFTNAYAADGLPEVFEIGLRWAEGVLWMIYRQDAGSVVLSDLRGAGGVPCDVDDTATFPTAAGRPKFFGADTAFGHVLRLIDAEDARAKAETEAEAETEAAA